MEGSGREAMGIPGFGASYYMHRGVPGTQPASNGPPGFRPMPNVSLPVQPNPGGGSVESKYPMETPPALAVHGVGEAAGELAKRKRGRPRKYGPEGDMSLALSPLSATTPVPKSSSTEKRGRGRPPGSGRKQLLASLGEWISGSAGIGFTPHVIIIETGEDIAAKVMSFSQQGPRAVCILSANGAVSTVTLQQSSTSVGTVTLEGRYEILCLSGSYTLSDDGSGHRSRTGCLTISLSSAEGQVIGGEVRGRLIAATPVQIIVGSFMSSSKKKNKGEPNTGTGPATDLPTDDKSAIVPTSDKSATATATATPASLPPSQALTSTPTANTWPASRHVDMRNAIDLTNG